MSLEDVVDSYKRGEKSLKKKLLPFIISSSLFSGIFSSFANEAPIIEWEKSFSLPNQTITYPSDIAEIALDKYFIHGFTDNEGNEDCLPLFSSTISQFDQSTEIKERFGSCVNIYSNLIKYDQNKFLFGTTEFYHDEESYYKLFNLRVFDDKGRITLTKTLPQDLFSNKYLMFHIDDDLYAIGGSEDSKGINIIKFDENLNISQGYPKEILEDKSFYLTAVNVIDEKIVLTALRSDPVLYPGSYSTSFIKLDIDFNLEYFQDYGRFAIPKGNIEKIDGGYIFATDINTPWEEDDIAIFTTNLNGELKEGFPLEIDLGTNYLVNFSKNPEGNYTILSSNKGGRYFSPHLTAIDSKGKVLWKKNYTSAYERLISGWDFTSDGGYVLTGRQDSQSAFILKLSPEIFTPTFYDPTGIHGNHFNVNADGYNFSSWQPTPEESQNQFIEFIKTTQKPNIDVIGVTFGPGLEPALWVGINFAKALGLTWNMPVVPINHMEGHIVSVLTETIIESRKPKVHKIEFPAIALLISGGHTELVLIKNWGDYEVIGKTRDDAVGEAFDKVARMLSLPYPGGKEISRLAEIERTSGDDSTPYMLPRPMLHSPDLDFSFSGLKTAVLYTLKEIPEVTEIIKQKIAKEFEDAIIDVIITKTKKAMSQYETKTLIVGGGVSANKTIQKALKKLTKEFEGTKLLIPEQELSTDNALMIAIATYTKITRDKSLLEVHDEKIVAEGNAKL